jgi:hypothetical protein
MNAARNKGTIGLSPTLGFSAESEAEVTQLTTVILFNTPESHTLVHVAYQGDPVRRVGGAQSGA